MTIYLWGHTKGGVGKTAGATNMAVALALLGRRVCLVDADGQLHANLFASRRLMLGDVPRINCQVLRGKIRDQLLRLARDHDDVVVDAHGGKSQELITALRTADVCLAPFAAMQPELDAFGDLAELVEDARCYHDGLRVFGVGSRVDARTRMFPAACAHVRGLGFDVLDASMALRPGPWGRASGSGRGIHEMKGDDLEAARELDAVLSEIHARMAQRAA